MSSSKYTNFPIIQVKNLPYKHKSEDLFTLFSQFGNIHEIRVSNNPSTTGQAIVVYKNLKSALLAVEKLSGFNYFGRYLVVKQYIPDNHIVKQLIESNTTSADEKV